MTVAAVAIRLSAKCNEVFPVWRPALDAGKLDEAITRRRDVHYVECGLVTLGLCNASSNGAPNSIRCGHYSTTQTILEEIWATGVSADVDRRRRV